MAEHPPKKPPLLATLPPEAKVPHAREIHPQLKLFLAADQVFFGPGPFLLLSLIETQGSLRLACAEMGMSYSKSWKMIEHMEEQLGFRVILRKRGGSDRGHSEITLEGRDLLHKYNLFQAECTRQMQQIYHTVFGANAVDTTDLSATENSPLSLEEHTESPL